VRLSNVSLTPNKQLDRHIYSFTATATEVLEPSPENYVEQFSPEETGADSGVWNVYLVAGYYGYDDGVLYVGSMGDNPEYQINDTNKPYVVAPTWNRLGQVDVPVG
jgi:hypothetical protein